MDSSDLSLVHGHIVNLSATHLDHANRLRVTDRVNEFVNDLHRRRTQTVDKVFSHCWAATIE